MKDSDLEKDVLSMQILPVQLVFFVLFLTITLQWRQKKSIVIDVWYSSQGWVKDTAPVLLSRVLG